MAYLDEITGAEAYNWDEEGIYQLEENDPVQAGPGGISNRQATELALRTRNLHVRLQAAMQAITDLVGTADQDHNTLGKLQEAIEALDFSDVNLDALKAELRGNVPAELDTMEEIIDYIESLEYLPTFRGTSVQSGAEIDWSGTPERTIELLADTEFSAINLIAGKTIGMKVTGNYTATFSAASGFVKIQGSTEPLPGETNYVQMKCLNATPGSELIVYLNFLI